MIYLEKNSNKKYKVCLEYHLGNCNGPCEDFQEEERYNETIKAIRNIVKGNFKESLDKFQEIMQVLAEKMEFEEAQKVKEKLNLLSNYQSKSTIVNPSINNVDVFPLFLMKVTAMLISLKLQMVLSFNLILLKLKKVR